MANEVKIVSPMATVSANKDYVTVLSIGDEPLNSSQTLFADLSLKDASRNNKLMYNRYRPSCATDATEMRPSCSRDLSIQQGSSRKNNAVMEINGNKCPKKNSLHGVDASPKQARRIEFDDTASRSRAKSHYELRTGSLKETEQFKRIHKSGFFGGLPDTFTDDFNGLLPDSDNGNIRAQRIVLTQDTFGVPIGISVTEVPDPKNPGRLSAVEIYRIEDNQRIALDGQLQIGDRIIKINNRPVYQMSLTAARLYIDELKREEEPSIVFYRLLKVDPSKKNSLSQIKPVTAIVQQGNTSVLHNLKDISIVKSSRGFGFRFASRRSERGNIFLITHVIPNGPSDEFLLSGDRLLKIDDKDLSSLVQSEVTDLLKSCPVGMALVFQISRTEEAQESNELVPTAADPTTHKISGLETDDQILEFQIPVNEKAAAGLGLVLKGKPSANLDDKQNAAVFIDRILRGSAAYRDGRLKEGDRILGIENLNLLQFKQNSEAAHAFNSYVSSLPSSCAYFRIFIARKADVGVSETNTMDRKAFIVWMTNATKHPIQGVGSEKVAAGSKNSINSDQDETVLQPQPASHSGDVADDAGSVTSTQQLDPFNRESASRKSFSEKGPFGMRVDPSRFESFKHINHQRQISAPTIGYRRQRAQLRRQRSAVVLKNNTNENQDVVTTAVTDPTKQKGFSFLSFFGLRSSTKALAQADKENIQSSENPQTANRRSMSEERFKNASRLRMSASNCEKLATTEFSSPLTTTAREALRKKRRSVGTSMLKFFQRHDSPSKTPNNDENSLLVDARKPLMDLSIKEKSPGNIKQEQSPQLRPLSALHHRRFNSAHDGLKQNAWSLPTNQQRIDGCTESRNLEAQPAVSPNKQLGSRRRTCTSHSFKKPNSGYGPSLYVQQLSDQNNYYNVFNQCFAAAQAVHPFNSNSMPFYTSADSTSPSIYRNRAANPPAYSPRQPHPAGLSPAYFQQRHPPAYYPGGDYFAPFYPPIQYSPTFPSAASAGSAPANAVHRQQYMYFGGIPTSAAYSLDYGYNTAQPRRLSTRSASKFSQQQPFDIHVERL